MLYYAALPGATPAVKTTIFNSYAGSMETGNSENLPSYSNKTDAYMAFLTDNAYSWGVNQSKGDMASMFLDMNYYNLNAANATNYKNAAAGYVHYFHGVNPISKTYLTNMGQYGAENSATTIYHLWFDDGTPWDEVGVSTYGPAPGFIPGGPNKFYTQTITPPAGQPEQKSYADFNGANNAYEVTENGIYYQAGYVRMLANFVSASCRAIPTCAFQPLPGIIQGESYCTINGVQTETTTDTGGGLNVGWTDTGDWMNYSINASAGTYTVDLRVASPNTGSQIQIKSGSTVLAKVTIPNTGGFQNWQTVTSGSFSLPAGNQTLQVLVSAGGWNLNWLDFKLGGNVV